MKDNLNIENLFKKKFENFEGDVDPNLWNGISQGIGTSATTGTATGGISALVKTVLISGGIVAASLTAVYFSYDDEPENNQENLIVEDNFTNENIIEKDSVIIVENENDPVILQHKDEIERELNNKQYEDEIDESLVNEIIFPNGENQVVEENNSQDNNQDNIENTENRENNDNVAENTEPENNENIQEQDVSYPSGKMEHSPENGFAPLTVNFKSNPKNHTVIKWSFGDGTTGKGANIQHTYSEPGEYTVTMKVVGKEGKIYEEIAVVEVKTESKIEVSNVFSPNGDGVNDQFKLIEVEGIETFYIKVTDLFGNKIFESHDVNFEWDGTDMSGNKVPQGKYIYAIIATGEDGSVIKIPGQLMMY